MALFGRRAKKNKEVVEEPPIPTLPTPPQADARGLRSLPNHRDYVLSLVESLRPFGMRLLDAWGHTLYEDLRAEHDLPNTAVALVDGYAVRVGDDIEERRTWGVEDDATLRSGIAVPILAGQPLPGGGDAVLSFDHIEVVDDVVASHHTVSVGDNVMPKGAHLTSGGTLASVGNIVDDRVISLLAAAGIDKVLVRPHPRVAVVSVGSGLIEPGKSSLDGQSYDVNSYLLAAAAKQDGASTWRIGSIFPDAEELREIIADQLIRADLIIAVAATSEERTMLEQVMSRLGKTDFTDLAMRPGGHFGFGLIGEDDIPMLVVPGEVPASYIGYQVIGRPVIRKLMGTHPYGHETAVCVVDSPIETEGQVIDLLFAKVEQRDGQSHVTVLGDPRTPTLADLHQANALVVIPEEKTTVAVGETVMCWLLDRD